ncbi:MAG: tetratricopeptide repeat protein [Candidatus Cloacimonetes bacterium]|jgi:signal transduction histidine kinase|nr:tetratricopeptide repeat protein [Candidatus Cloacimonadota bacterium]MCK9583945.1 tetratricopeptide repeat protein [Candidatus Cloacimonadota bacterium]MDY0230138.1 tetratricopeptide repeat protein [Candidatus Cloacimonadaceae bacterium]
MKKNKLQSISPEEIAEIQKLQEHLFDLPAGEAEIAFKRLCKLRLERDYAGDVSVYVDMMFKVGKYYGMHGMTEQSAAIFTELIAYAQRHKLSETVRHAKVDLAVSKAQSGKLFEALENWQEVLPEINDPGQKMAIMNNICAMYGILGDLNKAIDYAYRTIDLAEAENLPELKITPLTNLGTAYDREEEYEKALKSYYEALKLAREYNLFHRQYEITNNLSVAHTATHEFDKALQYAFESLELRKQYTSEMNLATPYNNIGFIYENSGDFEKALHYYNLAEGLYKKDAGSNSLVNCIINQASIYMKQEQYEKALERLAEADRLMEHIDGPPLKARIAEMYADVYAARQDFARAYEYQRKNSEILRMKLKKQKEDSISKNEAEYYQQKIEKQALNYRKQNTELKKKNRIISKTTKELKQGYRSLSDTVEMLNLMISVITHDVRAPLANYIRIISMMLRGEIPVSEHEDYMKSLKKSGENVFKLIDEMLDGIRLQRRKIDTKLNLETCNIVYILASVIDIYQPIAKQKSINLNCNYSSKEIMVKIDNDLLKIVVRNLLNNALKFTPFRGEVCLDAREDENTVEITIKDNGVGMSPSELSALRKGQSITGNKTTQDGGIGLGLVLLRDSLKKMKGKLTIESEPGQGTKFTIQLPLN